MLHGIFQGNFHLGVLKETNVTGGIFEWESSRNRVAAMAAPIQHSGGIMYFYRKAENFSLEALCLQDPNVVSFQLVMGQQRWNNVG